MEIGDPESGARRVSAGGSNKRSLYMLVGGAAALAVIIFIATKLVGNAGDPASKTGADGDYSVSDTGKQLLDNVMESIDMSADPCDDFYQYSCGKFLADELSDDRQFLAAHQANLMVTPIARERKAIIAAAKEPLPESLKDDPVIPAMQDMLLKCMDTDALDKEDIRSWVFGKPGVKEVVASGAFSLEAWGSLWETGVPFLFDARVQDPTMAKEGEIANEVTLQCIKDGVDPTDKTALSKCLDAVGPKLKEAEATLTWNAEVAVSMFQYNAVSLTEAATRMNDAEARTRWVNYLVELFKVDGLDAAAAKEKATLASQVISELNLYLIGFGPDTDHGKKFRDNTPLYLGGAEIALDDYLELRGIPKDLDLEADGNDYKSANALVQYLAADDNKLSDPKALSALAHATILMTHANLLGEKYRSAATTVKADDLRTFPFATGASEASYFAQLVGRLLLTKMDEASDVANVEVPSMRDAVNDAMRLNGLSPISHPGPISLWDDSDRQFRGQANWCVSWVAYSQTFAMARFYTHSQFFKERLAMATALAESVVKMYQDRLKGVDWFDAESLAFAEDKAKKMRVMSQSYAYLETPATRDAVYGAQFGATLKKSEKFTDYLTQLAAHPAKWRAAKAGKNYVENGGKNMVGLFMQTPWRPDGEFPPFMVNAFYSPQTNAFVLLPGYLGMLPTQLPNLEDHDVSGDDLVESVLFAGGVSTVIGHEISHGFDPMGSKFDAEGKPNPDGKNFYTEATDKKFEERLQCVTKQYDAYSKQVIPDNRRRLEDDSTTAEPTEEVTTTKDPKVFDVDGTKTLGENVADQGAIMIGLDGVVEYVASVANVSTESIVERLDKKIQFNNATYAPAQSPNGVTLRQLYFLRFGQLWCDVFRPGEIAEATVEQLSAKDPHAPGFARVWGTVSNSATFAKTYNCPATAKMHNEERCLVYFDDAAEAEKMPTDKAEVMLT